LFDTKVLIVLYCRNVSQWETGIFLGEYTI